MNSKAHPPDDDEPRITRLDFDANRGVRPTESRYTTRSLLDDDVSFMNEVADGIIERDRRRMRREATRTLSFVWSVFSCLCAGSITTFSIYGSRFLEDLHYSQYQVNGVSITSALALYLTVPFFGYVCDRYSPRPLSLISSVFLGGGYLLAAYTFKSGPPDAGGWPYWVMIVAFVGIGSGTLCMYLAAVSTCAKNYANAKYRGLVLSMPIASYGLSGMWISLVGEHLLADTLPNGRRGHVNVFKYFVFLGGMLIAIGLIGFFTLNIVDEEHLIEHGIEVLEQSGLLDESQFFRSHIDHINYGTLSNSTADRSDTESNTDNELTLTASQFLRQSEDEARLKEKKTWLLNYATHSFLTDRTMWLLAAGFLLATGPGESYINNLGTIIPTLTPAKYFDTTDPPAGYASTHVSIIAATSTFARLFSGTVSDLFSPSSKSLDPSIPQSRFSRLALLLPSAILLVFGFLNLALPFLTPAMPSLFHLSSVLIGLGYGALFSLVPIIISVVWGPENFATNWGVVAMTPAAGATIWSLVYSAEYSRAADELWKHGIEGMVLKKGECQGYNCYGGWAWGCAASGVIATVMWGFAWRTWNRRNVVV